MSSQVYTTTIQQNDDEIFFIYLKKKFIEKNKLKKSDVIVYDDKSIKKVKK